MTQAAVAAGPWSAATLWLVFLTGLVGGFGHCVGMCGPLVGALGFGEGVAAGRSGSLRPVGGFHAAYHAGRVLTYTLIGGVLGWLGAAGVLARLAGPAWITPAQRWISLVAGAAMVAMGLALAGAPLFARLRGRVSAGIPLGSWFSRASATLARRGATAALPLGMLMGLLPCGFLLTIEVQALAAGSPAAGAATMLAFGIGTVPALAAFGVASGALGWLGPRTRGWLTAAGGVMVVGLGALTIARALAMMPGAPMR